MGELLGITGAIGSGKTTFAQLLCAAEPRHAFYETGMLVAEVGNAFNKALKAELAFETTKHPLELANQVLIWLPDSLSELLHHDVVWNQLAITKRDTLARPELYEKLFSYLKQVGRTPSLATKEINQKSKETYRALLQWLGSYLVAKVSKTIWYDELMRRIQLRDDDKNLVVVSGVRYPSDAEVIREHGGRIIEVTRPNFATDSDDPTEAQRSGIAPDITIINSGSEDQLAVLAESLWRDLAAGQAQRSYTPS